MTEGREQAPGLYVHLPFCSSICPYCDFYVLTGNLERQERFVQALRSEIAICGEDPWPSFVEPIPRHRFDTIYLGGGTPSILQPEQLQAILETIEGHLNVAPDPWIGLEANPEDVTEERLANWRGLGVGYLSLGIQSFDQQNLGFLGRAHDPLDCRRSALLARECGFDTLSFDLIYGLPGQTESDWRRDLESALDLGPDHLSCYQLTFEPGTPFGFRQQRGDLHELASDPQADLFLLTHNLLEENGFAAYEVSSFARALDSRSRHNQKYWHHAPYLGLGPSAHSFAANRRWWNVRKIKPYTERIDAGVRPIQEYESLTSGQRQLEHLMLGLRTPAGIDFGAMWDGGGERLWQANRALIDEMVTARLVRVEGQRLVPTLAGLARAEALARRFELLDT